MVSKAFAMVLWTVGCRRKRLRLPLWKGGCKVNDQVTASRWEAVNFLCAPGKVLADFKTSPLKLGDEFSLEVMKLILRRCRFSR